MKIYHEEETLFMLSKIHSYTPWTSTFHKFVTKKEKMLITKIRLLREIALSGQRIPSLGFSTICMYQFHGTLLRLATGNFRERSFT